MMFGFPGSVGLSGCCGGTSWCAIVGEERSAYRHLLVCVMQCGTTGKSPSSYCKDLFLTLWNVGSCSCLSSTQHLSPFHIRARTFNRPRNATLESWSVRRCWVSHILRKMKSFLLREMVALSDTADANFTQWSDSTHCPTAPVVHKFTGVPSGLWQTEAPHINKDSFLLSVFKFFFFEIIQMLVQVTNRYDHQFWTHWTKVGLHCLMWLFRKCVCFWQLLYGLGMIRRANWKITGQH